MKVQNMTGRTGTPVANQFIIDDVYIADLGHGTMFQSYNSNIVFKKANINSPAKVYLDENRWNYSRTTGKYRNEFLGESIDETRKKIKSGEYKLVNLND